MKFKDSKIQARNFAQKSGNKAIILSFGCVLLLADIARSDLFMVTIATCKPLMPCKTCVSSYS